LLFFVTGRDFRVSERGYITDSYGAKNNCTHTHTTLRRCT